MYKNQRLCCEFINKLQHTYKGDQSKPLLSPVSGDHQVKSPEFHHDIRHYKEVITVANPFIDITSRKPTGDNSAYIISIFTVLKGDDGELFEKNWLTWTGKPRYTYSKV